MVWCQKEGARPGAGRVYVCTHAATMFKSEPASVSACSSGIIIRSFITNRSINVVPDKKLELDS